MLRLVFVLQDNEGQTALHYGKKASFINLRKCLKKCTMYFLFSAIKLFVSVCVYFSNGKYFILGRKHPHLPYTDIITSCVCALYLYIAPCFLCTPSLCPHLSQICHPCLLFLALSVLHSSCLCCIVSFTQFLLFLSVVSCGCMRVCVLWYVCVDACLVLFCVCVCNNRQASQRKSALVLRLP